MIIKRTTGILLLALSTVCGCKKDFRSEALFSERTAKLSVDGLKQAAGISADNMIVDGYTNKVSYNAGDTIYTYLSTTDTLKNASIGLYNVNHEQIGSIGCAVSPQQIALRAYSTGFKFQVTFKYVIPAASKSGLYFWGDRIPFIIRNTQKSAPILVVYDSNTQNAYNDAGGKSLYSPSANHADTVSFLRTTSLSDYSQAFLRWIPTESFDTDYICDQDMDNYSLLKGYKLIVIVGHSEYWSRQGRINFNRFVDEGANALILSGNTMWWHVRYTPDKTAMVCYKDHVSNDPEPDVDDKTTYWYGSRLPITPNIGMDSQFGGYGAEIGNGWGGYKMLVDQNSSPLLSGTSLNKGDRLKITTHEYDAPPTVFKPNVSGPVFDSTFAQFYKVQILGYDSIVNNHWDIQRMTTPAMMVFQKSRSSGIIVNFGTTNWCASEGLAAPEPHGYNVRQITINALTNLSTNQPVFSPGI